MENYIQIIDGCKDCLNNKPGLKAGLFCINNCINGSKKKIKKSKLLNMKKLLTILLIISSFTASAQKCFIGNTVQQVKTFYINKGISPAYFIYGKFDSTNLQYFMIDNKEVGHPIFSATFDKAGRCIKHQLSGTNVQLQQWLALLNKNKSLTRNDATGTWHSNSVKWDISEVATNSFDLICVKINR